MYLWGLNSLLFIPVTATGVATTLFSTSDGHEHDQTMSKVYHFDSERYFSLPQGYDLLDNNVLPFRQGGWGDEAPKATAGPPSTPPSIDSTAPAFERRERTTQLVLRTLT